MSRCAALLFGLNYAGTSSELRGCANDCLNTAELLRSTGRFDTVDVYLDDRDRERCTARGMVKAIARLAAKSWSDSLDIAWIHYSGHGSYERDTSGDELDGRDEGLCPVDYAHAGLLRDDDIRDLLRMFNPATRVVLICDCCHSGTIGDLRWRYDCDGGRSEEHPRSDCKPKVLLLSGCGDPQTSADAYGVGTRRQFSGAMTSCLLLVLRRQPDLAGDALGLLASLRTELAERGFEQVPQLCASYDLSDDGGRFLPFALPAV